MEPKELAKEESLILSLLKQVGLYLQNKFYSFKNVYDKDTSYVMENFVKEAEEIIFNEIRNQFPRHRIVSSKKPNSKQLNLAQKGGGAKLNGLPIQVSGVDKLQGAYVFVELPETEAGFEKKMDKVKELIKDCKQVEKFRIGALAQCLVASGSFDAYVDFSGTSTVYGQAASRLIIEEAGGQVFNLAEPEGENISWAATNRKLKEELDEIINLNI